MHDLARSGGGCPAANDGGESCGSPVTARQRHALAVPPAVGELQRLSGHAEPCSLPRPTAWPPNPPTDLRRKAGRPGRPLCPEVPGGPASGRHGVGHGRGPSSDSPGTRPPTSPPGYPDGRRRPARPPRLAQGAVEPGARRPRDRSGEREPRRDPVAAPSRAAASRIQGHPPGQTRYRPPS